MKHRWLCVAVMSVPLMLHGCGKKPAPASEIRGSESVAPLAGISDLEAEVFPLSNGNAYLVSNFDQELFLLVEGKAKRIENVKMAGLESTVYALPNGAAYFASSDGKHLRLYYLVGDKASLVQEGAIEPTLTEHTSDLRANFLWTQIQTAMINTRRAKQEAEDAAPPSEEPDRD